MKKTEQRTRSDDDIYGVLEFRYMRIMVIMLLILVALYHVVMCYIFSAIALLCYITLYIYICNQIRPYMSINYYYESHICFICTNEMLLIGLLILAFFSIATNSRFISITIFDILLWVVTTIYLISSIIIMITYAPTDEKIDLGVKRIGYDKKIVRYGILLIEIFPFINLILGIWAAYNHKILPIFIIGFIGSLIIKLIINEY